VCDDDVFGSVSYPSSYSGYQDELAWAALWLHKATGDEDMLELAKLLYDECCSFSVNRAFSWDDKGPGVQILMYKHTGKQSRQLLLLLLQPLPGNVFVMHLDYSLPLYLSR